MGSSMHILDEFTKERREDYRKLSLECMEILSGEKRITCTVPDSGFYLFIDIQKLGLDDFSFCCSGCCAGN